jgi:hypothetical protein
MGKKRQTLVVLEFEKAEIDIPGVVEIAVVLEIPEESAHILTEDVITEYRAKALELIQEYNRTRGDIVKTVSANTASSLKIQLIGGFTKWSKEDTSAKWGKHFEVKTLRYKVEVASAGNQTIYATAKSIDSFKEAIFGQKKEK